MCTNLWSKAIKTEKVEEYLPPFLVNEGKSTGHANVKEASSMVHLLHARTFI